MTAIALHTEREHLPVGGGDTTILVMPKGFYVDVDGRPALAVAEFSRLLSGLAQTQAANLGEELHHADFVVTRDPELVRRYGSLHECARCEDGTNRTLAYLATHPDDEIVVGQLFWVGR